MAPRSTLFTKEYIQSRVQARRVSLKSQIEKAEKVISDWWLNADDKLYEIRAARNAQVDAITEQNRKINLAFDSAKTAPERHAALESMSSRPFDSVRVFLAPGAGVRYDNPAAQALEVIQRATKELLLLDHAAAYLDEMPATEFSVTSLRQLGLLDAVKFSLGS